ncbi:MAG: protein phosphatase 2C domain-containing protein [Planctomycetota bacterium]|nr:protein phosphatase 2C domain-containing protein [Planctomycetota bacterium]
MTGSADSQEHMLFVGRSLPREESFDIAGGRVVVYTAAAPAPGESDATTCGNEDAALVVSIDETKGVLAVADGMGGRPAGEQASALTLRAISASIREFHVAAESTGRGNGGPGDGGSGSAVRRRRRVEPNGALREPILNGFELANKTVGLLGLGAGTTLAVVEIDRGTIRPYHAGDSMILVVGQRGKIKLQTVSHSPVGYAVEAGMLEASEAMHHESRHLISNMIGTSEMRIEIGPVVDLLPKDTLLLASDGLFDNLHIEEIVDLMRRGKPESGAQRVVELCHTRMRGQETGSPSKPDDLTLITFRQTNSKK